MNTIKKHKKIFITVLLFVFIASATLVFAINYTYLEPGAFSGIKTDTTSGTNSLSSFLGQVFNFGIAAAVVLALVMIVWGGITYMTTDSWSGKEDGKTKIKDALYGLGLALVSYLILYTINPCTVDFMGSKGGCQKTNTFITPAATR